MGARPSRDPSSPRAAYALLPAAILLAPVLSFLVGSGYSLARPEAVAWVVGAVAAGIAAGAVALRLRGTPRAVLLAGCVALFADLQFAPVRGLHLLLLFLALAAAIRLLGDNALPVLSAGFGTLLAAILLVPPRTPLQGSTGVAVGERPVREELPPIVVLVLDEHLGTAGFPQDVEGSAGARDAVRGVFAAHGFRLLPRAYSQYANTVDSLGNLFNFSARERHHDWIAPGAERLTLRENAFLRGAARAGYALRVYQSDHLDLCRAEGISPESCLTYKAASTGSLQGQALPWREKAALIGHNLFERTALRGLAGRLRQALRRMGLPLDDPDVQTGMLVGPIESMAVLERLRLDVSAGARGRLFLAHLMIPHFPYVYDGECRLNPRTPLWQRPASARPGAAGPAEKRREKYRAYFRQVECLARRLDGLFASLESSGALRDATVVVLGDHGSRISLREPTPSNLAALTGADLVDSFSALFAFRAPGVEPGEDEAPVPLVRAFAGAVGHRGRLPRDETIRLREEGVDALTPARMPAF